MSYHAGIDPGLGGAIAILKNNQIVKIFDMPTIGREVDAEELYSMLLEYKITRANLEMVHSFRGQGVKSTFSFGRSFGVVIGVLAGSEIPIKYVTPQEWKKRFCLTGTRKDAARERIIHMMPEHKDLFKRKKDVDRADAVFIGLM